MVIPERKQKHDITRGQASLAKMTSLRGKLTAPACHPTKFVNKPFSLQTLVLTTQRVAPLLEHSANVGIVQSLGFESPLHYEAEMNRKAGLISAML